MGAGKADLTKATTAYFVALAFALTFLLTIALGSGMSAALTRGIIAAIAFRVCMPFFVRPVMTAIFDAMARDQQESAKPEPEAEASE